MIALEPRNVGVQTTSTEPGSRLRRQAAEFEGLLLSQVLEKLKEAYRLPGTDEIDSAGENFQSLANSALGNSLAARGGMGLTDMLVQALTRDTKVAEPVKPPTGDADVQTRQAENIKAFSDFADVETAGSPLRTV